MEIIKYIGFVNSPIFILITLFLISQTRKFNFQKDPVCKLGSLKTSACFFNKALIIYSIGQLAVVSQLLVFLNNPLINIPLILLVFTSGFGLLTAIITMKANLRIHIILAKSGFTMTIFACLLFGLFLLNIRIELGLINILIPLLTGAFLAIFLKFNRVSAAAELVFFLSTFIWDMVNSYYILLSK